MNWIKKPIAKIIIINLIGIFLFSEVAWVSRLNFASFLPLLIYQQASSPDSGINLKEFTQKITEFFVPSAYAAADDSIYGIEHVYRLNSALGNVWQRPQEAYEEQEEEEEQEPEEKKQEQPSILSKSMAAEASQEAEPVAEIEMASAEAQTLQAGNTVDTVAGTPTNLDLKEAIRPNAVAGSNEAEAEGNGEEGNNEDRQDSVNNSDNSANIKIKGAQKAASADSTDTDSDQGSSLVEGQPLVEGEANINSGEVIQINTASSGNEGQVKGKAQVSAKAGSKGKRSAPKTVENVLLAKLKDANNIGKEIGKIINGNQKTELTQGQDENSGQENRSQEEQGLNSRIVELDNKEKIEIKVADNNETVKDEQNISLEEEVKDPVEDNTNNEKAEKKTANEDTYLDLENGLTPEQLLDILGSQNKNADAKDNKIPRVMPDSGLVFSAQAFKGQQKTNNNIGRHGLRLALVSADNSEINLSFTDNNIEVKGLSSQCELPPANGPPKANTASGKISSSSNPTQAKATAKGQAASGPKKGKQSGRRAERSPRQESNLEAPNNNGPPSDENAAGSYDYNCGTYALWQLYLQNNPDADPAEAWNLIANALSPYIDENGQVSMADIQQVAESLGLNLAGVELTFDQLANLGSGAIVHLNINGQGHWVTVLGVEDGTVIYMDNGIRKEASAEEFQSMWDGFALVNKSEIPSGAKILDASQMSKIKGAGFFGWLWDKVIKPIVKIIVAIVIIVAVAALIAACPALGGFLGTILTELARYAAGRLISSALQDWGVSKKWADFLGMALAYGLSQGAASAFTVGKIGQTSILKFSWRACGQALYKSFFSGAFLGGVIRGALRNIVYQGSVYLILAACAGSFDREKIQAWIKENPFLAMVVIPTVAAAISMGVDYGVGKIGGCCDWSEGLKFGKFAESAALTTGKTFVTNYGNYQAMEAIQNGPVTIHVTTHYGITGMAFNSTTDMTQEEGDTSEAWEWFLGAFLTCLLIDVFVPEDAGLIDEFNDSTVQYSYDNKAYTPIVSNEFEHSVLMAFDLGWDAGIKYNLNNSDALDNSFLWENTRDFGEDKLFSTDPHEGEKIEFEFGETVKTNEDWFGATTYDTEGKLELDIQASDAYRWGSAVSSLNVSGYNKFERHNKQGGDQNRYGKDIQQEAVNNIDLFNNDTVDTVPQYNPLMSDWELLHNILG